MNKFFSTIRDIWSIKELRDRITTTVVLLLIFRLGTFIVLPGIDPTADDFNTGGNGVLDFINVFLGGAFSRYSIFALGIMPYITASIVIQLAQVAIPEFQKMQKDGESGRKKITQITRVLTIIVTMVQGFAYLQSTVDSSKVVVSYSFFMVTGLIILVTGTMFCMWLGERITDKGIGNGISMLIMIGIISALPGAIYNEFEETAGSTEANWIQFLFEFFALFFVVALTVLIVQAVRRVPVQMAKQMVGNKVVGGKRDYIPLKVNTAGVMPIIFAQALMFLPSLIAKSFADTNDTAAYIERNFSDYTSWQYSALFALLIIIFTFVYTAITINPKDISDGLKRNGGFVPGVKPGDDTENYIGRIIDRITLPGSVFLAGIAILPAFVSAIGVGAQFAQFFGGTSLLILVGVVLDTLQQINSYLLMRKYDGMMKSGKVRGDSQIVA